MLGKSDFNGAVDGSGSIIRLEVPDYFDFGQCREHLAHSENGCLVTVKGDGVYKGLRLNGIPLLIRIFGEENRGGGLRIHVHGADIDAAMATDIEEHVRQWFDLERDLAPFNALAERDELLRRHVRRYSGLRMLGNPSLYESLCWAIIGQQITASFAFQLKQRVVRTFGESVLFEGERYYLFPGPEVVANLTIRDMTELKLSQKKAEYLIEVARQTVEGSLTKDQLLAMESIEQAVKRLTAIRGVGAWTANYAVMLCLRDPQAFPIADVGLHRAIQHTLGLARKPTLEEIRRYAVSWEGWEAYATFYLWRGLEDHAEISTDELA